MAVHLGVAAVTRPLSRRGFLALAAGGTVLAFGADALLTNGFAAGQPGTLLRSACPLPRPYRTPLPIPPVLRPVRTTADADYYEITQQVSDLEILPGLRTRAWTYGGGFPGPTLVSRSGRRTVVRHTNRLPRPTVVHLHGGHTPHEDDGYPADLLDLGATRDYTYPLDQRAATLWYHDHRMGFTGPSVWFGLAGFHLVHDDEETLLPLPAGERDIPLMIADRAFTADGQFAYPSADPMLMMPGVTDPYRNGVLGDVILVNGAPWPVLDVHPVRYRFRLLNAANARQFALRLDPPGRLTQIGSDGGLLAAPVDQDAMRLAPAERADVVIDFAGYRPGTRVRLRNDFGAGGTAEVMCFDVSGSAAEDSTIPAKLATIERLDPATATVTRDFVFQNHASGWKINGAAYDPAYPLALPRLGDTEIWRFTTDFHHPVHLHLDPFQVLARNGGAPGRYDGGWKDTIDLRPAETAEIAVRFTDYAGRFVFHCHNLEHEDMAMMADFVTH